MEGTRTNPKVFVSYSWSSPEHEQWVIDFAGRLTLDGIEVKLDKWDLKEGHNKHAFMEQLVNDADITRVLVICDKVYQQKANARTGGVGTESILISKEVYDNVAQEKFLPIIKEFDNGKPCVPHFMGSTVYIDLTTPITYEENYQKVVRNIYGKPLLKRPPIGLPPAYILEEDSPVLKTAYKVATLKDSLINAKSNSEILIIDYLDSFIVALKDYLIEEKPGIYLDDQVVSQIEKMLPLRNDFIDFVATVLKYQPNLDIDGFHSFFEKLLFFKYSNSNQDIISNYIFFIYELMLYFIAALIKFEKYQLLSSFLENNFFFKRDAYSSQDWGGIEEFYSNIPLLDSDRNNRLHLQRVSIVADLVKQNATRQDITFEDIKQCDLLLYYINHIRFQRKGWFPLTSVYRTYRIDLLDKMISKRHFEKIKSIWGVDNVVEFKEKIEDYKNRKYSQFASNNFNFQIPTFERIIDMDNLGML